jgi:hypothetical protein
MLGCLDCYLGAEPLDNCADQIPVFGAIEHRHTAFLLALCYLLANQKFREAQQDWNKTAPPYFVCGLNNTVNFLINNLIQVNLFHSGGQ